MGRWLDRLSNWQFVAVVASAEILALTVEAGVFLLVTGHVRLRFCIPSGVLITVVFTATQAWKRWK
ncbi:MAG TPA: hypothetical protein VGD68_01435 [Streptosporangiaceae bacterium]